MADLKDFISPVGTILAAVIGIVGSWLAFIRAPRKIKSLEFRLKYVEEQLAHLYGPLWGVLEELEAAYQTIVLAFGLPVTVSVDPYLFLNWPDSQDHRLWKSLCEKYLLPYNDRALAIISNHSHLLGPAPPSSLADFVEHAGELRVRFALLISEPGTPMAASELKFLKKNWPARITAEVQAKVQALLQLQREYRSRLEGDRPKGRLRRNRFEINVENDWLGPYVWAELQTFIKRASLGRYSLVPGGKLAEERLKSLMVREKDHSSVDRVIPYGGSLHLYELERAIRDQEKIS